MFVEFHTEPGFGFGFTDRHGGASKPPFDSLNLGKTDEDEPAALAENISRIRNQIGVQHIVALSQVHGNEVFDVDQHPRSWDGQQWLGSPQHPPLPQADAAISSQTGIALMIRVADCVPVLLRAGSTIAAAHAGRAGLTSGVLTATVQAIRQRTDQQIQAWIGPHICGKCYELPKQLVDEISQQFPSAAGSTSWGTPAIDLGIAAETQLVELGVSVTRYRYCTRTDRRFYSHRANGPQTGRQAGLIWARPNG